jgi:xanthine dehydrogenase small subunit
MRDHVRFYLNRQPRDVHGDDVRLTVSDYLRLRLRMAGTKIVCSEGDCGACSVLIGRPRGPRVVYEPIDSCILFIHQIDGTHLITIEGLGAGGTHPIQQALVDHHASQCGYCTPGMAMALAGWAEAGCPKEDNAPRIALTGNLCRCTGYQAIFDAADAIARQPLPTLGETFAHRDELVALRREPLAIETPGFRYFAPTSLMEAARFKAEHPDALIVAGATEIGVWRNKRGIDPPTLLSLSRIAELDAISATERRMTFGANATWSRIESAVAEPLPEFRRIIQRFGSPQIRGAGTLAGNVANGSPIADALGLLTILDAEVELVSVRGQRSRPIDGFYLGYKRTDMAPDEFISRIHLPLPHPRDQIHLSKVSRRFDMDIATFGAAIRLRVEEGAIALARIALTGVAPTVIRAPSVEEFLVGQPPSEERFREAGRLLRDAISPITDVRGSREFRLRLAENCLTRFYFQRLEGGAEVESA